MENKVAVILLNWNGLGDTTDCIESLLISTYPHVVIYVVDNASGNNEAGILEKKYPGIKVLPQTENLGFCAGNNVGIRKAIEDGATYCIVLNNDTLVPPEVIGKLISSFGKLPLAGAVSPVILEHPATDKVWFSKAVWQPGKAQFRLNEPGDRYELLQNKEPFVSEFACGCCLLTSAEIINNVGLLDERYFAFYDEADWCRRLSAKGYMSMTIPETFIYHKVSKSTPGLVSTYLMARNRLLWMKEHLSFRRRRESFVYLNREFFWHLLNRFGLRKGVYSREHSRAYLQGVIDFRLRRFGKWSRSAAKIFGMRN